MIKIYKLGTEYLRSLKADKNSAWFELNQIKNVCDEQCGQNILVVVGGKACSMDFNWCKNHWNNFSYHVFIMTDTIAFEYLDFVNSFDLVLHQAWKHNIKKITTTQMYGFIPELFYVENDKIEKSNIVLFGGNNLNRQDELAKFVYDSQGNIRNGLLVFSKNYDTKVDNRLAYSAYLQVLKACKYSLVVAPKDKYEMGWLTARCFESLANWTMPLFASEFDKNEYFIHSDLNMVKFYGSINYIMQAAEKKEKEFNELLLANRSRIEERKDGFANIILNI